MVPALHSRKHFSIALTFESSTSVSRTSIKDVPFPSSTLNFGWASNESTTIPARVFASAPPYIIKSMTLISSATDAAQAFASVFLAKRGPEVYDRFSPFGRVTVRIHSLAAIARRRGQSSFRERVNIGSVGIKNLRSHNPTSDRRAKITSGIGGSRNEV